MPEIILTIVIIVLLCSLAVSQYISWKEREKLMKMIMAKDLRDYTANEALERLPDTEEPQQSDVMSMDDAVEDDKVFDLHIAAVKKKAEEEFLKAQDKI